MGSPVPNKAESSSRDAENADGLPKNFKQAIDVLYSKVEQWDGVAEV